MRILVLDTIHGGSDIGAAFAVAGHSVDMVDVYRNTTPSVAERAKIQTYDLVVAPVHLDPDYPLLAGREDHVISHHEAVRRLLGDQLPIPMVEITGAQGKTTTAHALAHLLPGNGVLHTSAGTCVCPDYKIVWKKSITPASVLAGAELAKQQHGWLIAEESLGVTGAGNLAIITSSNDYSCAAGKKHALAAKLASTERSRRMLLAPGICTINREGVVHLEDVTTFGENECTITVDDYIYTIRNPLLAFPSYRTPLALAGAAAVLLGIDPAPLAIFSAVRGRMSIKRDAGIVVVDNSNSGTNTATTVEAAGLARREAGMQDLTLVIGTVAGDGAVCEGFPLDQIDAAIGKVQPNRIILVGDVSHLKNIGRQQPSWKIVGRCMTLDEAYRLALRENANGSIVLAVKTWR